MAFRNCFCCLFISVLFFSSAKSQQAGYIYIQAENNIPYEVKWNGKTYPSSPSGYTEIPGVPMGTHTLVMRFSPEISDDFTFTITLTDKSRAVSLRQAVDNSWTLFDMADYTLIKGTALPRLAKPAPVEVPQLPVENKPAITTVTEVAKPVDDAVTQKQVTPPARKKTVFPLAVQKIFDKSSSGGIDQVYIVTHDGKTDTIAIFIPVLSEKEAKPVTENRSALLSLPQKKAVPATRGQGLIAAIASPRSRFQLSSKQIYAPLFPGTLL